MAASTSAPLVDVTSPFWVITSDSFLSLAFIAPLLSLSVFLLRTHVSPDLWGLSPGDSSSVAPAEAVSPEQLAARSGEKSAEQLDRDRAEGEQLKQDALAKAKAADGNGV